MATRKQTSDPVNDLENQITKLNQQLNKARDKQLADTEKSVARATKVQQTTQTKLRAAKEKLKAVRAAYKTKPTAASGSRIEKTKQLVSDLTEALTQASQAVAAEKEKLKTLRAEKKLNIAIEKATARVTAELVRAASKPRKRKPAKTTSRQNTVAPDSSVEPGAEKITTPVSPSLFGPD